jgi:diguanylate cyclase (GGDEF)-like protein
VAPWSTGLKADGRTVDERNMSVLASPFPPQLEGDPARHMPRLLDRLSFFEHLQRAIGRADGLGGEIALFAMALDPLFLTAATDSWETRQEVSIVTGCRLVAFLHHSYVPARIAGDELLVLAEGVRGVDDALELAEEIVTVVRWSDFDLFEDRPVTASVGVALHQAHSSAEQLLIKADMAMYVARREGGDRMQIFEEWMRDSDTPTAP